MKVYRWLIGTDDFTEILWPPGVRLPCAGETYLVGPDTYQVEAVQWETDQGVERRFSVQIQLRPQPF